MYTGVIIALNVLIVYSEMLYEILFCIFLEKYKLYYWFIGIVLIVKRVARQNLIYEADKY